MWNEACREGDLAPGGVKEIRAGDVEVAVCRVAGSDGLVGAYYAVGRRCGHKNAALERGALDGPYLTCPLHYVQFDVRTGRAVTHPDGFEIHDLPTYPVRVRDGLVEVGVPDA